MEKNKRVDLITKLLKKSRVFFFFFFFFTLHRVLTLPTYVHLCSRNRPYSFLYLHGFKGNPRVCPLGKNGH